MMSQEITRDQSTMLSLRKMKAEQRFALFLLNLSSRQEARGYSATNFQLRISRAEIGNYFGLTIESISRLISRFKREGRINGFCRIKQFTTEIVQKNQRHFLTKIA